MANSNALPEIIKTYESVLKMSLISEAMIDALNDPSLSREVKVSVLKSMIFPSDAQLDANRGHTSAKNTVHSSPPEFRTLVESYLNKKLADVSALNRNLPGHVPVENIGRDVERAQKTFLGNIEKLSAHINGFRDAYIKMYENMLDEATVLNNNVSAASLATSNLLKKVTSEIKRDADVDTLRTIETALVHESRNLSEEQVNLSRALEPFKGREREFLALSAELDELNKEIATVEEIVKLANQWNDSELNESVMNLSMSEDSLSNN